MNKEIWKSIEGWSSYEVSSQGRVKSLRRTADIFVNGVWKKRTVPERILKPSKNSKLGHLRVDLQENTRKWKIGVHQLVALTFIPNPKNFPFVLHDDGNPANNCVVNLKWGTAMQNTDDRHRHGTTSRGSHRPAAKLTETDIPLIRRMILRGIEDAVIGEQFRVSGATINSIRHGKTWKHIK